MNLEIKKQDNPSLIIFICLLPILAFLSKSSSDITLSFMGLFFVFYSIKHQQYQWLAWPWVKAMLAFITLAMLSSVFSPFPQAAFTQSFIYLRWPLAALALVCLVLTTPERLRLFEKSALLFLVFIVADTVLQIIIGQDILGHQSGNGRMTGPFSKRLVGVYSLKLFFFAFTSIYFSMTKNPKNIILLTLLILVFNIFLLMTGERMVFIFGFLFFCLWFAAVFVTYKNLRKKIVILLTAGLSAFSGIVIFNHEIFVNRFMPFVEAMKNFSSTTYADIFRSAFELWQLSPWIGVGTRMYHDACVLKLGYPTDEAYFQTVDGICQHHPHNIYLEVLAQNGLLGLGLFLTMLFFIFKTIVNKTLLKRDFLLVRVLFSSLLVIFWPLTSSMSIFSNNYSGAVWLTIGWALARAKYLPQVNHT